MKKHLRSFSFSNFLKSNKVLLFSILLFAGIFNKAQAQSVYYMTSDGVAATAGPDDAIYVVKADGTGATPIATSITASPGVMKVDVLHDVAYFTDDAAATYAIKKVDLLTGVISPVVSSGISFPITAIDYNPQNDYLYYIIADPAGQNANTALWRVKSDGTDNTKIVGSIDTKPGPMTLDFTNNRAIYGNTELTNAWIKSINLSTGVITNISSSSMTGPPTGVVYSLQKDAVCVLQSDRQIGGGVNAVKPSDAVFVMLPNGEGGYNPPVGNLGSSVAAAPVALAIDFAGNFAYFTESKAGSYAVKKLDISTGISSVLSTQSVIVKDIDITNSAPFATVELTSQSYTENAAAVQVSPAGIAGDEDGNWSGGTFTAAVSSNSEATDMLAIGTTGGLSVSGGVVSDGATDFGTVSTTDGTVTGSTTLTVTFTANATNTRIQKLLGALTFSNSSDAFSTTARVVTVALADSKGASVSKTRSVNMVPLNDAPVLSGGPYTFTPTNTSVASPATMVSDILDALTYTDADAATSKGIAITITSGTGTWQYSTNGTTWSSVGSVNVTSALLLSPTSYIRYIGGASAETASILFRGWDQSTGTASTNGSRSLANPSSANGGTTAFSSAMVTANLSVTADVTPPAATTVAFTSGNADPATAHIGDVVTLTFTTSEAVQLPVATISGHSVTVTSTGGNDYTASYTMLEADAAGNIAFSVDLTDLSGLTSNFTNVSTGKNIVYNNTPTIASTGAFSGVATPQGTASASTHVSISGFNLSAGILVTPPTGFEVSTDDSAYSPTVTVDQTSGSVAATNIYIRLAAATAAGFYSGDVVLSSAGASDLHVATATSTVYSTDATLSSLTTTANGFAPTFDPNVTTGYTASVPNATTTVTVTPTVTYAFVSDLEVRVNGGAPVSVVSGNASAPLALNVGNNTIDISVTAQDGTTTKTYTLTVNRPSNNIKLSTFKVIPSVGSLTIVPGSHYRDYEATIYNPTSSIQIQAFTQDATATLTINGASVASGTPSDPIHLNPDTTTIYTTVTAGDGITRKTYAMTVTLKPSNNAKLTSFKLSPSATLTPVAGTDYKDYTATVKSTTSSISILAISQDAAATITVNGMPATSGTVSSPIHLNLDTNTIYTTVTAGDGVTKKTYAIVVTRPPSNNAVLTTFTTTPKAALTVVPGTDYKDYEATIFNPASSISIIAAPQDATATFTVNGLPGTSGTASDPINLNADTTTIYTTVTAGDGVTKKTYALKVTRQASNNAVLATFTTTPKAALTAVAGTDYRDYEATVFSPTSSISIIAAPQDATATFTVNGLPGTSGTASAPINLNADTTTIYTTVTAGDGVTKKTYALKVTRQASNNAVLTTFTTTPKATLTAVAGTDYRDYVATVSNSTSSISIFAVTQDATSAITVNGAPATSGTASDPVHLNVDTNTIYTTVTAGDGVTKKTYAILITRAAPPGLVMKYEAPDETLATGGEIVVHQNVSPNGDGRSDGLVIEGIAAHPDNRLQIMSRSGNLVYEAKGYDNATKIFDGHAGNGKLQQAGTYFYSLEYKVGNEIKHKTGYFVLKY